MTGMQTKVFDAQDALVASLQAAPGLVGWTIGYGLPARRDDLHVWVDEQVSEWTQDQRTTGLVSKEESFKLHVYVYVRRSGASAQDVRDECKGAGAIVEQVIAAAPFLGGVALFAQTVGGEYDGAFADPEGRAREGALHMIVATQTFLG